MAVGFLSRIILRLRGMMDASHADMELIDYVHAASLSFDPKLPSPLRAYAIGWLGSKIPCKGEIDQPSMLALREAQAKQGTDMGELGYHRCCICRRCQERGEFIVRANGRTYVLPRMVLHYIEAHNYLPPEGFLSDLRAWSEQQRPKAAEPLGAGDAGVRLSATPKSVARRA